MFLLFKERQPRVLGIDISPTSVKLLELNKTGGNFRVESYAVVPLPQGSIIENDIKDLNAVAEAIRLAVSRSGTKLKNAATAVASSTIISKVIQIDAALEGLDLELQIDLEARRFIPFALEEVALDFEILGINAAHEEKVDVLVVASRQENVELRSNVLRMAGLNPMIIDVESYAMERASSLLAEQLPDAGKNKIIAIVDVGSVMTTITVLNNMQTVYTREEFFGGRQLTEAIQRRYGLSYDQAGYSKKQHSNLNDYGPALLEPFRESLVPLIRRSLQFFFASSQFNEVDHIILAGGGAMIPGLKDVIKERLGTQSTIANPFANMSIASHVDVAALTADAPALMICCGLALRSFDKWQI